ncbi:MAG: hypothetical protein WCY41_04110 [Candidatus Micrarchaeia archaeon]
MGQDAFALACVALLLAAAFSMPGCTSNKYVPCCVRTGIYADDGSPQSNPQCTFQNGTLFGSCMLDENFSGVASCGDGTSCGSIKSEDLCTKTSSCVWNESLSPKCSGAQARWLLPVCADRVPASCVNERCTAMICGYANTRPSPPPASQDWDANKSEDEMNRSAKSSVIPVQDMVSTPAIGLQHVTCDFNKMSQKLYDKVKAARGNLWVNSFRFGVGQSFADFEQARNFFPATDIGCAANPDATIDRYTAYLNVSTTYCVAGQLFQCYKGSSPVALPNFSNIDTCKLYCGNGTAPYSCNQISGGGYACKSDGFSYSTRATCEQKCSRIDDTRACANDTTKFPFLDSDGSGAARFRMKYVSDYMVDTDDPYADFSHNSNGPACYMYGGPTGDVPFGDWVAKTENGWVCNDYADWGDGPWFWTQNVSSDNSIHYDDVPGQSSADNIYLGELRTYFDNHAYSTIDYDYEYYEKNLMAQYSSADQSHLLPFECESGADCKSGTCDKTYHSRALCVNKTTNLPMACSCSSKFKVVTDGANPYQGYYPYCDFSSSFPIYYAIGLTDGWPLDWPLVGLINNSDWFMTPEQSVHYIDGDNFYPSGIFHFYSKEQIPLFSTCGVPPVYDYKVSKCFVTCSYDDSVYHIITEPINGGCSLNNVGYGSCSLDQSLPQDFYEYYFDYAWGNQYVQGGSGQWIPGQFGTQCVGTGVCENGDCDWASQKPPYVKINDYGWCAGCTYTTLAVQKVDWGLPNPGGNGSPRASSCYEYRGDFNYIPNGTYPYGGVVGETPMPSHDGIGRWQDGFATPSTEPVRMTSNPSSYEHDNNGNIEEIWDQPIFWCRDKWNSKGWWSPENIPTPSAPYMKEKLTSYLQSNVMPILDEIDEKTTIPMWSLPCTEYGSISKTYDCKKDNTTYIDLGFCQLYCSDGLCSSQEHDDGKLSGLVCPYTNQFFDDQIHGYSGVCAAMCSDPANQKVYAPLSICNELQGDGAVVHAIGNSTMLGALPEDGNYGNISPYILSNDIKEYTGIMSDTDFTFNISNGTGGKNAILIRTYLLKNKCDASPLVGIEIMPDETETTLIGTPGCDLTDPSSTCRGKLHKFFYSDTTINYAQMVVRGLPDKYPDQVDMLLQDWYPMCNLGGRNVSENEIAEFERRLDFSRALLSNFSKPSLIWSFAFPVDSNCNQTIFLDYMFNHTADMVDAGIIGVIYSGWETQDGKGYGPESRFYNDTFAYPAHGGGSYWPNSVIREHNFTGSLSTGLTMSPALSRTGKPIQTLEELGTSKKGDLFCALEDYSIRTVGYMKMTYGQKVYAENHTCYCEPCSSYDYATGVCDNTVGASSANMPQHYCNDGAPCAMPINNDGSSIEIKDYYLYKCPSTCMNASACTLCNDSSLAGSASFCRISISGGPTRGYSWNFKNISDDYWEFLTGLSPNEKCCLTVNTSGSDVKYTYVALTGTKQQAEFLQYPTRGEYDIDCGRAPDTSVLTYCNIRVHISQKEIACMKISKSDGGSTCGLTVTGSGTCNGGGLLTDCNALGSNQGCCEAASSCHWDGATCHSIQGSSSFVICSNYNDNQLGCEAFSLTSPGCVWVPSGGSSVCGAPNSGAGTCSGAGSVTCSNIGSQGCCEAISGCQWGASGCTDKAGSSRYVICSSYDNNQPGCNAFSPCTWHGGMASPPGETEGDKTTSKK